MHRTLLLGILLLVSSVANAEFPPLFNTEPLADAPVMTAAEAASTFTVPDGFRVTAVASEPDVMNPIAMTWDSRGRLWIAENFTYAERQQRFQLDLRDRVVILDPANQDDSSKKSTANRIRRTVFTDNVQMLTGIEVGHGGVWLMCPPKLIFIPDADGDDVPDGPGEVVLDGFDVAKQNYHNFANGIRFGPDGWLYGRCGGSCPGRIGKPSTPRDQRPALEGGIWRYHPKHKIVEVLTAGTTNPWGHDWNDVGEMFFCNTVNGHLWHMIPGAHFPRPFTLDPNRRAYEMIEMHADHWHFDTGQSWTKSRDGAANDFGGGHAHCGTLIYQGDQWPDAYVGKLLTFNFHGRRANQERIERHGSGYVLRHEPDMMLAKDPWFRGMDLSTGPDGNVFAIDWSDTGECHEHTGVHRESGRVYKISYGDPAPAKTKPASTDVAQWSQTDLANAHLPGNRWQRRQARMVLIGRANAGQDISTATKRLHEIFSASDTRESTAVQSLLTLHACGETTPDDLTALLDHPSEYVRVWAIRLLSETWPLDDVMGASWKSSLPATVTESSQALISRFATMASQDPSAAVRLALASTLQRLPLQYRASLAKPLAMRIEDADDHNIPLMTWYGVMPLGQAHHTDLVAVASTSQQPRLTQLIARCLAEEITRSPAAIDTLLAKVANSNDRRFQLAVLRGVSDGLRGWASADRPMSWDQVVRIDHDELRPWIRELSVVFGDGRAMDEVKQIALGNSVNDSSIPIAFETRLAALETLIQSQSKDLRPVCEKLINDARMNVLAAKGLATFDDPKVAVTLVSRYNRFRGPDKPQIVSLLSSRKSFASELLEAIGKGKIPRQDLSAFHVRQIQSLGDAALNQRIGEVWGEVRESSEEKQQLIEKLKTELTSDVLSSANRSAGRALFQKHCQNCHRLYGEGGQVGPDLSGGNRSNLDYLLSNIIDPSSVVDKNYRMTIVLLDDGRVINGLLTDQSDQTLTIHTATEQMTIPRDEVEMQKVTEKSPMPEGLLDTLSQREIRDLFSYLSHHSQVALP
ncbi:membrane-bound dehydrogenase domain-containing protein [Rhodopirellula maiorica SM1]|uniref:Membrane-bound dehydrogenase domain-containing protein n=1 Tax=Rhodopirellula maiorica SM1 TaxID=1265738 RepID=M5RF90_9BACT|nr:PVC-type heme-binding CxxCH protein [Rhodopirellula maiorica]EMI18143.1 membrane-bound dehydrogenase domain-containing protein [Rhodopirellula maiorica SM1]